MTPCMPCSFEVLPHRRSGTGAQPNVPIRVTAIVRWLPLVTAAYGTWVARPAGTTSLAPGSHGSHLGPRVRPVLGDPLDHGQEPKGSWRRVGRLELWPGYWEVGCHHYSGGLTCGYFLPFMSVRARCTPTSTGFACTHRVPRAAPPAHGSLGTHPRWDPAWPHQQGKRVRRRTRLAVLAPGWSSFLVSGSVHNDRFPAID
jgi:hypothetical protein